MTTKQRFTVTVKQGHIEYDYGDGVWTREQRTDHGIRIRSKTWRYVSDPDDQAVVEVEVNFEALAATLGPRAARSKGGKAQEVKGLVVVRHVHQ